VTAFTTFTETIRRPRLSLGAFVIAIVAVLLAGLGLMRWWKSSPYKPSPVALDWYNKGTEALSNGAFLQASKALEQSVLNDNKFAIAHARLAEAWTELEYDDKAKDELLRVQSLVPNRSQLANTDALYLEGINATVTRDYAGAVRAYAELVRLSPNDPKAYVDLGRAYEKNDEIKKAIESYVEATNRDPQYATAFLRVGILYGRQANMPSASAAFDKADALYQALGNYEGRAEVSYQRGSLFDQRTQFAEARQHLQQALELARTTGNEYQQVKSLQKLGNVEIDAYNVPEGRKYMLEAIQLSQTKGIDNLTKRGLIDLGNTFIAEGNYSEAENYFKQSLDLAQKQNDARNSARAWLALGSVAERRGNSDEVLAYIDRALPFYQQGGYRRETLQGLTLRARARVQKGDYDAALQAFEEELKLSQQFGDQAQVGLAHEDIGLLFIRQGRYPEALSRFEESYKIAVSLGTEKNIGLTLTDRANALWRLGRYDEARAVFREASPIAERPDAAKNLSGPYYLAIARMALTERQLPEASAKSQKAFAIVGTQFKRAAIAATYTDGLTQVLLGKSAGRLKCEQALEMAKQVGDPTLLSEALLNLAQAQLQSGDPARALESSLESQALFAKAGNRDNEWIAWLIAARSSRSNRDLQNALDYAARADKLLTSIEQQWGGDNYSSYLKRPDIQLFRAQLNQLLAEKT
jgi:tetratricopeptide (TPR) repeat protein